MKTLKLTAIILLSITLTFCSNENDSDGDTNVLLVGSWRQTKVTDITPEGLDEVAIAQNGYNEVLLEINSSTLTYIEDNNCDGATDGTITYNYSRSNNTLTINGYPTKITTLTETILILEQEDADGSKSIDEYERL